VDGITSRVGELLPWIRHHQPMAAWAGFRPAADSQGPLIHHAGDTSLWLAYGHYRNGILLAPVTAKMVSEGILGSRKLQTAGTASN
jgi:glycine oxidase